MITLFHGENTTESRKVFIDEKQKNASAVTIEGQNTTIALLSEKLEGQGLFEDTQIIFIEDLLSKKKASKDTESLAKFIVEHEKENQIYIWESKQLTLKQLNYFKGATVKKFDLPKEIFAFLDSILPNNAEKSISLFQKTLQIEDAEFVFFMIVRQVRMLLSVLEPGESGIDEIKRVAPWQLGKLQKQAKALGKDKLLDLFYKLFTLEQGLKTGKNSLPIAQMIDFLLVSL
ncbi:MAG TPA: hypothetical protein VF820_04730 [Patescibacteria group bacterium]